MKPAPLACACEVRFDHKREPRVHLGSVLLQGKPLCCLVIYPNERKGVGVSLVGLLSSVTVTYQILQEANSNSVPIGGALKQDECVRKLTWWFCFYVGE